MMSHPLKNFVLCFLLFYALAAAVTGYAAQHKPSDRKARPRSSICTTKKNDNPIAIRFDYYPPIGESGLIFVSIHENGRAKVVRYGPYFKTDPVKVHQGILARQEMSQLISRIRKVMSEWSPDRSYDDGFQDESVFHLSIAARNSLPIEIKYSGLTGASREVAALVDELRMLWERLEETPAAYAYVRSKPIKQQFPRTGSIQNSQGISIRKFPRQLRALINNAIKNPLDFHALSRSQVKQLLVVTSNQFLFSVNREGFSPGLTLYVAPRNPHK